MDFCSEKMIENYLLYKNPLYAFRFPLALLFGIFFYGFMEMKKWSSNSYINQIFIPITAILVMMVILDILARMMISKKEKKRLLLLCKLFKNSPSNKLGFLNLAIIENLNDNIENFENSTNSDNVENKEDKKDKEDNNIVQNTENTENFSNNFKNIQQIGAPMNYIDNQEFVNFDNNSLIYHSEPQNIESKKIVNTKCIQNSDCCSLCSGMGDNPCNILAPIPGPQWLPQTAFAKQNELKNNIYSPSTCPIKN